jgi:leucyl-tRNA synthetase
MLAPITPHLAEEIHHYRSGTESDPQPNEPADSVFQQRWQGVVSRHVADRDAPDADMHAE